MAQTLDRLNAALADRYRIEREIGRGGMGTVFLARDLKHSRPVALKILNPQLAVALGPGRFLREIAIAAGLNHPHILALYDSGQAAGTFYFTMPYVEGESLRARLLREGQLPLDDALTIAREVADALGYAHAHDVIHRDIKPENILLSGGHALIVDFGIGRAITAALGDRLTETGLAVGTPGYMSPEQGLADPDLDGRSDLYSLGCVTYEMLAGHPPFLGATAREVIARHMLDPVPPLRSARPAVPAVVEQAVGRALAKVPADRFATAGQFADALSAPPPDAEPAPQPPPVTSIAVLPFLFLNEVETSPGLSLGFADALITMLGSLEDVVVRPTSAILKYAPGSDAASACRDLGVRHILQGSVQQAGAQWRVSIQLFDATTQRLALSENQDFRRDTVFEVQDEIGRRVVHSLHSRFLLAAPKSRDRYSSDPDAYNEFMSGLRDSYGDRPETLERAAGHLSAAVERDPAFALAHAWLSYVSMNLHFSFDSQRTRLEKAEHHCRRALELDPALPEAHLARSWILWSPAKSFQHAEAIAELEQVLSAQPNLEQAHNRMASICMHIGRLPEARIALERAQRANPRTRSLNLAFWYLHSGDYAAAEKEIAALLGEGPGAMYALYAHGYLPLLAGDLALAEHRLAAVLEQLADEPLILSLQGMLHARRNQPDLALQCVRRALESPRSFGHTHHTYYQIACVYAVLGQSDKAMAWLERSVETGNACWSFFRLDPHLESLRQQPAFDRLVGDLEREFTALEIRRL
jgi:eukaryotic-like serine/threonine-protein kinase